jgi:hypothetical protein
LSKKDCTEAKYDCCGPHRHRGQENAALLSVVREVLAASPDLKTDQKKLGLANVLIGQAGLLKLFNLD